MRSILNVQSIFCAPAQLAAMGLSPAPEVRSYIDTLRQCEVQPPQACFLKPRICSEAFIKTLLGGTIPGNDLTHCAAVSYVARFAFVCGLFCSVISYTAVRSFIISIVSFESCRSVADIVPVALPASGCPIRPKPNSTRTLLLFARIS